MASEMIAWLNTAVSTFMAGRKPGRETPIERIFRDVIRS
jgi:hypothetical protein